MQLIDKNTGDVIADGLTPADVRALYKRGVESHIGVNAEAGSGGGGDGEWIPSDLDRDDVDADDLADAVEAMSRAADDAADDLDLDSMGDVATPSAADQARYDALVRQQSDDMDEIDIRMQKRDADAGLDPDDGRSPTAAFDHETVRDYLRESGMAEEVAEAFRKLKTADVPQPADAGDQLHIENYVRHLAGDTTEDELYRETRVVETGDRAVGVAVDLSGSMDELQVKVALGALAIATREIGDGFVASGYQRNNETHLITAPDEEFAWTHLDSVCAGGSTPTATGVDDTMKLLQETTKRESLLIVITDGIANVTLRDTDPEDNDDYTAMRQAGAAVAAARSEGMAVIGLGVGDDLDTDAMRQLFGSNYVMAGMDGMADTLVRVYKSQLRTPQ